MDTKNRLKYPLITLTTGFTNVYNYLNNTEDWLVLDVECTNLNKGDPWTEGNQLLLACWFFRGRYHYSFGSEYEQATLLAHIRESSAIVAHNAKFELGWLHRCGYALHDKPVLCTMLGQYVVSGNRKLPLSLSKVADHYKEDSKESLVDQLIKVKVCPSEIPKEWLLEYCLKDVAICRRIAEHILNYCHKHRLMAVLHQRCSLTPVLCDIERVGMFLDGERVDEKYRKAVAERGELLERMSEITNGINTNSNPQLTRYLFEVLKFRKPRDANKKLMVTPSGATSVSKAALERLEARNEDQREFLSVRKELNRLEGLVTKYLQKMQDCCTDAGGILRASFNQTITTTHRLSSSGKVYNIQLQNINRDLKPLFKARKEGWVLMEADFSQLEFRIAVDLCNDIQGKKDIESGHDVHAFTATTLFDEFKGGDKALQKKLRTQAKAATFRPLFGGSSGTRREKAYFAAFLKRYADIKRTQEGWVDTVLRTKDKALVLPTGLRFFYPKAKLTKSGYVEESTRIKNAPIQCFASAEVTLSAVKLLWDALSEYEAFIVATIHDSIILEVPEDEIEQVSHIVQRVMTKDVVDYLDKLYNYKLDVPLDIDIECSKHWGE